MENLDASFSNIVDPQIIQKIQDKFSAATGLAAVVTDAKGYPVTKQTNFTDFCKIIRSSSLGYSRCMCSDHKGGVRAREIQAPYIYHCHAGLIDIAAPVVVKGKYIGSALCGQVVLAENAEYSKEYVKNNVKDLDVDHDLLMKAFSDIEVIPTSKVEASAELLSLMANYMVEMGALNLLQKRLIEETETRKEIEKLLKEKELKALQSQVNPHFLFNSLNTIARLSHLEGAAETENMVYALSDLLRYNLKNFEELVKIEEEIKVIKDYLLIQKTRFQERLQFEIDIEESILNAPIPPLTLQPLVENAIIHGLEVKEKPGNIIVKSTIYDKNIHLEVIDNGVGICEEKLNEIFKLKNQKDKSMGHTTGLGLINVHRRLQHYFGSDGGVEIFSREGEGTRAKILLPGKKGG
ncbi:PocR ligand-binding domain-containing protein [Natranaerofaba carboxydovora]|uniref:sensor histidine kinase n=1 Tax=Natranaerofaba carboxydovora TaxID=2742683 RepID=UPI001F13CB05|nr:PocR ligand-binding domain-containing protein [Natranaerofaba carboxydovora]UMZ72724.1 Sensor histidine kinase YehU [Natranaerofaba carboxydovora]